MICKADVCFISTPLYFVMAEYIAKGDNRFHSLLQIIFSQGIIGSREEETRYTICGDCRSRFFLHIRGSNRSSLTFYQ
jgi:hypothetical protein